MIGPPLNDRGCLGQLISEARKLSRSAVAKELAGSLGSLVRLVDWLHALPQADDDGEWSPDSIHCDVWQRLRAFPENPNCFERACIFLAVAERIAPGLEYTAGTFDTAYGRHTVPLVLTPRGPVVINVNPRVRNGEWYQDLFEVLHGVGKAVLTVYGAGGAADVIGDYEQKAGLRTPAKAAEPKTGKGGAEGNGGAEGASAPPREPNAARAASVNEGARAERREQEWKRSAGPKGRPSETLRPPSSGPLPSEEVSRGPSGSSSVRDEAPPSGVSRLGLLPFSPPEREPEREPS